VHECRPLAQACLETAIADCVLLEDGVEHIHVRVAQERIDVVIFLSGSDFMNSMVDAVTLCSRLVETRLRGWRLLRIWLEQPL
jgi:hypothetical protein